MMIRSAKIFVCLLLLQVGFLGKGQAQNLIPKNTVYLELLGNGGLYSLNYERNLWESESVALTARVGASMFLASVLDEGTEGGGIGFPLMLNALIGKRKGHLEVGVGPGAFIGWGDYGSGITTISGTLAYRRQAADGGFMFKIGAAPIYRFADPQSFLPLPTIAFGFGF